MGIAGPTNSRRHQGAIHRANDTERAWRAESVAMPVFAYICLYNFEMSTKARRALHVRTMRDRRQIFGRL